MAEFGEVLRPDMAIVLAKAEGQRLKAEVEPSSDSSAPADSTSAFSLQPSAFPLKPRLLIQILPPDQDLEKPLKDKHWKASPATRMTELLHVRRI